MDYAAMKGHARARGYKVPEDGSALDGGAWEEPWLRYWKACEERAADPTTGRPVPPHRSGGGRPLMRAALAGILALGAMSNLAEVPPPRRPREPAAGKPPSRPPEAISSYAPLPRPIVAPLNSSSVLPGAKQAERIGRQVSNARRNPFEASEKCIQKIKARLAAKESK